MATPTPTPAPSLAAASTHPAAAAALQSWRESRTALAAASPLLLAPHDDAVHYPESAAEPHCEREPVVAPEGHLRLRQEDGPGAGAAACDSGSGDCSASQPPGSLIDSLNERQKEAAMASEKGAVIVVAGPGSGKTRTLVARACYLVKHCKVPPEAIILATFTNKAAHEMAERYHKELGVNGAGLIYGTFHSIAFRLLKKYPTRAGLPTDFGVADEAETRKAVTYALKEAKKKGFFVATFQEFTPQQIQGFISKLKLQRCAQQYGLYTQTSWQLKPFMERATDIALPFYEEELLQRRKKLDFDDLLIYFVRMLRDHPRVTREISHVLVDELQDSSVLQMEIIRLLGKQGNVFAVGDPNQSIYSWRQASPLAFKLLEETFPKHQVIQLSQNYRSTPAVVKSAADMVGAKLPAYDNSSGREWPASEEADLFKIEVEDLWTSNKAGPEATLIQVANMDIQASHIAKEICRLVLLYKPLVALNDIAILVRTNAMTRPIEQAMVASGLPYRIIGSKRFFERMEIKDLMAYLLLIANDVEDDSFARIINVPPRGYGEKSLEKLQVKARKTGANMMAMLRRSGRNGQPPGRRSKMGAWLMDMERFRAAAQDNMRMADLLKAIISAIDYDGYVKTHFEASADDRLENVAELVRLAGEFDHNFDCDIYRPAPGEESEATAISAAQVSSHSRLALFLAEAAVMLNFDADDKAKKRQAVTISTIHAAKGLEWTAVFIPCCSEEQLPFFYALVSANRASLAEERRLLYVGMTRAKFFLQLGHCTTRLRNGLMEVCMPSRFVTGLRLRMQSHSNEELRSFRPELAAMSPDASDPMEERAYDAVWRAEESMRTKWEQLFQYEPVNAARDTMAQAAGRGAEDSAASAASSGIADGTIKVEAEDPEPRVEVDTAVIVNIKAAELDCPAANPPKKVKK